MTEPNYRKLGEGITLQAYAPIKDGYIRFGKNEKVTVFGRTEKSDVLHIEVGEKRGYAPENVIKIERMFVTKDQLVEVEVVSIQPSKTVSEEATQATVLLTEPVPTEATPSPAIVKRCRIYGTVMSGSICDDEDASELIEEVDAVTQLESSADDSPTSSLDTWSPSFTTDIKLDLSSEVYSGKGSEETVTVSSTELSGLNHTQGDDADVGKEKAASNEQPLSASLETAKDEGVEVSVEEEGEDERDVTEEKPIPGEVDEEDETPSEEDHVKESNMETTGATSSLEPSATDLDASSSDTVALSDLATPSLPPQQPDLATANQLLSSTVLPSQSSASSSEAEPSLPLETDSTASLVDKPSVVTALDGSSTESHLSSLPTSSPDVYSSQSLEQPSSLSTATSLPVETELGTNAVEEPAPTPSSIDALSDQLHLKPAASEDVAVSSLLLSEQSSPSTFASSPSQEIEPIESTTEKLSLSDATVPPVELHTTETSSSLDGPSAVFSSESDETPISSVSAPQPVKASLSSSSAAEPAVSESPVSSQEQQMQGSSLAEPLLPEPLRAALDRRLLPSPVTLLLACCGLLAASMAITLHAAYLCVESRDRRTLDYAGNMSMLEQRLFTLETERQVLSEQLVQAKAQADRGGRTLSQHERELDTLREEVQNQEEELRKLRTRLSEQTQKLEANQVALAVAQKTLIEKEAEASEQSAALASLERQLSEVCAERDLWRGQATESQAQERSLQQSLSDATDTSDRLWSELEALKHKQEALCEEVSASNQEATKMAEQLKQKDERIQVLESSLTQLEVLQRHRTTSEGENEPEAEADEEGAAKARLQELLDATQARKERDQVEEQRRQLQAQLDEMQEQLCSQQVRVESLEKELEKSAAAKAEAERQSAEAQTKLDVLSNYFKDRELQLQKEVGMQEVERRQRMTEASTATQQLALLEQQCQSYKSQLSSLRQEMELSERNYKNQVADQEKRAHENWLAARAAERKLEEANRDRTALRQRQREMQQPPPLPPGDLFPPRPPLLTKDDVPLLDGAPPLPPLDMLPPPPFPPFPPPPPPELLKHMRATGGSPHFFDMAPPPPPFVPLVPRPGRSSQASVSSSASDSRGRPLKSSPQPLSADSRRNGTGGRNTPL
ncbi:hypothetical protein HPB52_022079 [Rhipicephalus sanguineus]|uniref:Uncharacterized protein n=1 Tax=Rhipicephalus sanguineus TaxID=34632 RepID=A0A9D4SPR9_RHISA|nr:hypothetical protein HPB52_022079 [Rhipicephalus sanguineus]